MGLWPWLAPLVILSWVYFIGTFIRAFFWLTDVVWDNKDTAKRGFAYRSYRFARILYSWDRQGDERIWRKVWSSTWPYDADFQLHNMFFDAVESLLKPKSKPEDNLKAAGYMAIYNTNYQTRDKADFRLYNNHLRRLLRIYNEFRETAVRLREKGGSRHWGYHDISTTITQIYKDGYAAGEEYGVFAAVDGHATELGLKLPFKEQPDKTARRNDEIKHFLEATFEAMVEPGQQGVYSITSNFESSPEWTVTKASLIDEGSNISWLIHTTYTDWLYKWLENKKERVFSADYIVHTFYPKVNTIYFSTFQWFMFRARHISDEKQAVENMSKSLRPIGFFTNPVTEWSPVGGGDPVKAAMEADERMMQETAGLIATYYRGYLQKLWNLDKLIAACRPAKGEDDQSDGFVDKNRLLKLLLEIKKHYAAEGNVG